MSASKGVILGVVVSACLYLAGYVVFRQLNERREDTYAFTCFDENCIVHMPLMVLWYPLAWVDEMMTGRGYEMRDVKINAWEVSGQ